MMVMEDMRFFAFLIIVTIITNTSDANSWDLAVTVGRNIDFFFKNGTLIRNMKNRDAVAFSSISYDDVSQMIFVSDVKNTNTSIFTRSLQSDKTEMSTLLTKTNGSHITGITYDSQTHSLFWTDIIKRAIFTMHINTNMTSTEPQVLLNLTNQIPRGLSLDLCNRRLYWVNSNKPHPSIMSSNVDGTAQTVIISEDLYEPVAVTVDHATAKLYWLDDSEGIHYKLERSNLDGTRRELLVDGKHQMPIHIAVDHDNIYWTDLVYNAIWHIKKDMTANDEPKQLKKYAFVSKEECEPKGLLTRFNIGNVDCSIMQAAQINNLANETEQTDSNSYDMSDISLKKNETTSKLCLNGGYFNKTRNTCRCKQGFNGQLCEQSLCQNYCFHGECNVTSAGQVRCECAPEYSGLRCEKHICSDYCLNGGECSIRQGKPFCTCKFSHGNRCENPDDMTEICAVLCASRLRGLKKIDMNFCSCSKRNSTDREYNIYQDGSWNKMLMVIFSIIIGVLTILIVILSYLIIKFRRRPRIRKRFVVSKTGITPLTSRPQIPNGQCEITIENCCNMNICETPCFEPQLRSSQSNSMRKEDKNSLLENMDGNNSC